MVGPFTKVDRTRPHYLPRVSQVNPTEGLFFLLHKRSLLQSTLEVVTPTFLVKHRSTYFVDFYGIVYLLRSPLKSDLL